MVTKKVKIIQKAKTQKSPAETGDFLLHIREFLFCGVDFRLLCRGSLVPAALRHLIEDFILNIVFFFQNVDEVISQILMLAFIGKSVIGGGNPFLAV